MLKVKEHFKKYKASYLLGSAYFVVGAGLAHLQGLNKINSRPLVNSNVASTFCSYCGADKGESHSVVCKNVE